MNLRHCERERYRWRPLLAAVCDLRLVILGSVNPHRQQRGAVPLLMVQRRAVGDTKVSIFETVSDVVYISFVRVRLLAGRLKLLERICEVVLRHRPWLPQPVVALFCKTRVRKEKDCCLKQHARGISQSSHACTYQRQRVIIMVFVVVKR